MPTFDPRLLIQPGSRTSLPPASLLQLTDRLVADETLAWQIVGIDTSSPDRPRATSEEL